MGGARSEGQGGPQARGRKRALSLTAVSAPACSNRSTKAILALDRQHGIYRETLRRRVVMNSSAAETRIVSSSWDEPAGCLMTGRAATGVEGA